MLGSGVVCILRITIAGQTRAKAGVPETPEELRRVTMEELGHLPSRLAPA